MWVVALQKKMTVAEMIAVNVAALSLFITTPLHDP
jgi:hypothetical protein